MKFENLNIQNLKFSKIIFKLEFIFLIFINVFKINQIILKNTLDDKELKFKNEINRIIILKFALE